MPKDTVRGVEIDQTPVYLPSALLRDLDALLLQRGSKASRETAICAIIAAAVHGLELNLDELSG
jgi:hypothetical protein